MDNTNGITDKVFDHVKKAVKQFGGVINPWLWIAVLIVVYIGQTLTVQIFLWFMIVVSSLITWYPRIKKWVDNYREMNDINRNTNTER